MTIERKINLNKNIYYILLDTEYKKNKDNITTIKLTNYKDTYFDCGDISLLIKKIEQNYNENKKYDNNISFMSDIIYIYQNIPFISGIKNIPLSKEDNLPNEICYISKKEIEKYIQDNNIKINTNNNFKLYDERTWGI